jgi:opacity protein-like surface antigen
MKTLLFFIFTTFTASALADSVDYKRDGVVWLNAAIGQAKFTDDFTLVNEGLSLKFNIGYDFTEYLAVYGGIGSFQNLANKNINYVETGLKVSLPFSNTNWSAYTTLGGTSVTNSEVSGKVQPKIGVGFSYQITPKFSTQITYDYYREIGVQQQINKDIKQITWGITYFFNRPDTSNKNIQQIKIYQ